MVKARTRSQVLFSVGAIVGALLAGLYVVRFLDVEDCKRSDVACTQNFIRLPGIVFSWPVALAVVMTLGAMFGAVGGLAVSRRAERASARNRALVLFSLMVLLVVFVGVAGGRYLAQP
jgi:hypothetical protein